MEQTLNRAVFDYFHHTVYTVALYGQESPMVCKGHLVLRTYYKDAGKVSVDYNRTSDYLKDALFYETNKIIRTQYDDPYTNPRELIELSLPELGKQYRIIYNAAEIQSPRYDDQLKLLSYRDPEAKGVAIIVRRDPDKGIQWLEEREARTIVAKLNK